MIIIRIGLMAIEYKTNQPHGLKYKKILGENNVIFQ